MTQVLPLESIPAQSSTTVRRVLPWFFIAVGCVLRLIWPRDIEWKYDEKWMFWKAQRIALGVDPLPWVGMPSGAGIENPGLSIWPFGLLAHITHDPIRMTQAVMLLNVLALCGFGLWASRRLPGSQREIGLWGVALFAVSPLPVLFSRKIWAQDVLVVFVLPWLWAHSRRERPVAAFAWGLFGALLGQVHMSGFFAAAALAFATWVSSPKRFPWLPWLLGSACGALLLVPWLQFVLSPAAKHASTGVGFSLRYFSEGLRNAWGLGLEYPLGSAYRAFLRGPELFGVHTRLNAIVRYGLLGLLAFGGYLLVRDRKLLMRVRTSLALPDGLPVYFFAVVATGLTLCAARVQIYMHYLIVWGPLLHIAAAWLLHRRRAAVIALCALQLWLSVSFLATVHTRGTGPDADYGTPYQQQSEEQRRPLP